MASSSDPRSSSSASRPREASARVDESPYRTGATSRRTRPGVHPGRPSASRVRVEAMEERPSAVRVRPERDPRRASYNRKVSLLIFGVLAVAIALVGYLVVAYSGLFEVRSLEVTPCEHLTTQQVAELAAIPAGSTQFNLDERGIVERVSANPWVASVEITHQFPSQLTITVTERTEAAVVMLSSGLSAWRLSDDGYWLEELTLVSSADGTGASPTDQAREQAAADGVVFVGSVLPAVLPQAGATCEDEALKALLGYVNGFSAEMLALVASADASSAAGLSFVLTNGVEVSVGPAQDIADKETVIKLLLEQHEGAITYINVRDPANPTWRGL